MSWTAEVLEIKKDQYGIATASVRFTDGVATRDVPMRGFQSEENLKRLVTDQILAFEAADKAIADIPVGPFDPKPTPPPVPPDPTADEIARRDFSAAYRKLQGLKRAVDVGLITADDKQFTDALAAAQAAYQPTFTDLL